MAASAVHARLSRRHLLIAGAAAACAPLAARAATVYTPTEIAQEYARRVTRRLHLREADAWLYAGMAEMQLMADHQVLLDPQYLLVVDSNPNVQAALLFWRLLPGAYRLLGASPVSTGGPVRPEYFETPQGLFAQTLDLPAQGVLDFGWQRARRATRRGQLLPMRLQARAADRQGEKLLGTACTNGCVVMPASLLEFIDHFGLLDGDAQEPRLHVPCRGRYMLVMDSEREDRPEWLAAKS